MHQLLMRYTLALEKRPLKTQFAMLLQSATEVFHFEKTKYAKCI